VVDTQLVNRLSSPISVLIGGGRRGVDTRELDWDMVYHVCEHVIGFRWGRCQ
jgi:hypothetical protein